MPEEYDNSQEQGYRSINADNQNANQQQQKQEGNKTGIPDNLKASIEYMSGFSLNHVRVHYNSEKPAQIGALAYTDGNNIYIAPGQEQSLSHELWHIVQQMKGDVKEKTQFGGGMPGNQDKKLEDNADKGGAKANQLAQQGGLQQDKPLKKGKGQGVVQRLVQPGQGIVNANNEDGSLTPYLDGNENPDKQDLEIAALLKDADRAKGPFKAVFDQLLERTNAVTRAIKQQKKVKDANGNPEHYRDGRPKIQTVDKSPSGMGGLKGAKRIKQKMNTKYARKGDNAVININDVVRGTLAFDDFKGIYDALVIIRDLEGQNIGAGDESYQIARVKQIYSPASNLLYGDVKLNLVVDNHNCELQLNTVKMLEGKGTVAGHGAYEIWRDLDDEHWKEFNKELPNNIQDMPKKYAERAQGAIHLSQGAYWAGAMQKDSQFNHDPFFFRVIEICEQMGGEVPEENTKKREYYDREKYEAEQRYNTFIESSQ